MTLRRTTRAPHPADDQYAFECSRCKLVYTAKYAISPAAPSEISAADSMSSDDCQSPMQMSTSTRSFYRRTLERRLFLRVLYGYFLVTEFSNNGDFKNEPTRSGTFGRATAGT
jgi:hypothetical protein